MNYDSGEQVELGDVVRFDVGPATFVEARVVMLGSDGSRLEICPDYLAGIQGAGLPEAKDIVVEYLDENGSPGGQEYLPTTLCGVELLARESAHEHT